MVIHNVTSSSGRFFYESGVIYRRPAVKNYEHQANQSAWRLHHPFSVMYVLERVRRRQTISSGYLLLARDRRGSHFMDSQSCHVLVPQNL